MHLSASGAMYSVIWSRMEQIVQEGKESRARLTLLRYPNLTTLLTLLLTLSATERPREDIITFSYGTQ